MSDKSIDTAPPRRKRLRIASYTVLAIAVFVGIGVALLPTAATWQIETQLEKLGAKSVAVGSLSINPATGEIWVEQFKSIGPDGEDIVVGKAKLRIGLSALVNRQITIHELSVADSDIDIRLDAKGVWSVGGFPMAFASSDARAEPSEPWQLVAGNIAVDNSQMTLNLGAVLQKALVENLRLDKLSTLEPDTAATISLSIMTSGGKVVIDGKILPFANQPNAELSINTAALKLDAFKELIATGRIKDVSGTAAINGVAKAGFRANGGPAVSFDGKASLSRARVQTTLFQTNAKSLSWDGTAGVSLPGENSAAGALPEVEVKGVATADGFTFGNRISKIALSADAARFNLSKSGVSIKADPKNKGTTLIGGELIAKLTKAKFEQPETELTIAPDQMELNTRITLILPPRTAAFSATLSGVMNATALGGSLKPAGLDRLDVKSFRVTYENAVLNVSDKGAISGTVSAHLDLGDVSLEAPQLGGNASARSLESTGNRVSFGQTDGGALTLSLDGAFTAANVSSESTDKSWRAQQNKAEWAGSIGIAPTKRPDPADGLTLSGDIKLSGFAATLAADDLFRIEVGSANATGIAIAPGRRTVKKASVSGFSTAGATENSPLPRLSLKTLVATNITTDADDNLAIKDLRASGLSGRLVRSADGSITMPTVPVGTSTTKSAETKPSARDTSPPAVRIGSAVLSDSSVAFIDNAVAPPFSIETSQLQATLRDFDTSKPQSDAQLNVLLGLGKFGRVQLDGTVKPDIENTTASLGIGFKNIELFKFNAYILPAIKHTIRQGRADGDIDLKLAQNKLDAKTLLTISRLEVTPAPKVTGKKGTGSGPPIETALGLIQDKKGVVKLSIPITGSLEDPKFDLSDAIGQAIGGAMQKTFLTAVKIAFPLGAVVAIVDSVGAPKIAVKPLIFTAGSAALTPSLKSRIAEIAAYLKKKPKEAPSMCGPATAADLAALKRISPKADQKAALDLAAARVSAVRDELISTHSIAVKRFFICAPEFAEAADTVPSVTVDLKS